MIKVALLHFCFEDYTVGLANGLAKFAEVILIHPEQLSQRYQQVLDPNIKTISFWKPRIRDPRNLRTLYQISQIVHQLAPDVLHVQEANNFWYDLSLLFQRAPIRTPLVTTIHDVFRHPGDRDLVFGSEYTRRIAYHRSHHLIVHTHFLQRVLIEQFQVPVQQVSVIPHGELGSLYQQFAPMEVAQVLDRDPHTLLFFGRIWPYKGLKYLVEAMPIVRRVIPTAKLVIAGRGENLTQYFPQGCDLTPYEQLNQFIPFEAVAGLFERSAAVVLPYIESSQSGVAAIAYGTGTPVIASDIGGLAEMVHHEQDGLLVPPADSLTLAQSIIRLLQDRALQAHLQQGALMRCQQDLNWTNIAAQTIQVYQKVCFNAIVT